MIFLLFFYLWGGGGGGNPIYWGIKSWISTPGEISWTLSYLLFSTCLNLTCISASSSFQIPVQLSSAVYPHCGGQPFFRFSPPFTISTSNGCFPVWFALPSPMCCLHCTAEKFSARQSDHVTLWRPEHTCVQTLVTPHSDWWFFCLPAQLKEVSTEDGFELHLSPYPQGLPQCSQCW